MQHLLMIPGPTNVPARIMNAMSRPIINHRGPEFYELYDSILKGLKYAFQTENDVFALTASGTGGVECAIANIVTRGDRIIVPVNGEFSLRVKTNVERLGGVPIEIPVKWGEAPTAGMIEEALEKEKDVKGLFVVSNETSSGAAIKDLEDMGKISEKHDLIFFVDAISNLGGDPLLVDKWKVDVCVTCSQKCLACPPGLSPISISDNSWKKIEKNGSQSFYFDLPKYKSYLQRKETPNTPCIPLYYALDEGLRMLNEEGLENRIIRHEKCANAFYTALEAIGLELFARKQYRSNTVIAFKNPRGVDAGAMRRMMIEKYGVEIAAGMGAVRETTSRIGSMGIVSAKEVEETVNALEKSLSSLGFKFESGSGVAAARHSLK
ncbi:MAG: Alanine--glyoxylate aminotransferase family protein [Thermoproteota archaeon]|nr:Alanine--glyoxylate aminotransferase family protein [Thermoproteota archaeon]